MSEYKLATLNVNKINLHQDTIPNLRSAHQNGDKQSYRDKIREEGARIAQAYQAQKNIPEREKISLVTSALQTASQQNLNIEKIISLSERRLFLSCQANELFLAMRGGATGLGTEEKRIFRALEGLDSKAIREIRQIYFDHYGRDLEHDLRAELKSDKRFIARLTPLLEGDLFRSALAGVRLEIELPIHDTKEILRILSNQEPEILPKFLDTYRANYGSDLRKDLAQLLTPLENKQLEAILIGDKDRSIVFAIRNIVEKQNININELNTIIDSSSKEMLIKIQAIYLEEFGISLQESLQGKISNAHSNQIAAMVEKDLIRASAYHLRDIILKSDIPLSEIQALLKNIPEGERKIIIELYKSLFSSSLLVDLKERLAPDQIKLQLADKLISMKSLSESDQIAIIISELVPKKYINEASQKIEELINEKSKQEILSISSQLREVIGVKLEDAIQTNFKGSQKFDLALSLQGKPSTIEEEHLIAKARYEFERIKLNLVSARMLDVLSEQGKILDNTARKVNQQYSLLANLDSAKDEANQLRFYGLLDFLEHDIRNYRDAKKALAHLISNASSILIGFFGFFVSARSGYSFFESLVTALLFSGVSKVVLHSYLQSRSVSGDSIVQEVNSRRINKNNSTKIPSKRRSLVRKHIPKYKT